MRRTTAVACLIIIAAGLLQGRASADIIGESPPNYRIPNSPATGPQAAIVHLGTRQTQTQNGVPMQVESLFCSGAFYGTSVVLTAAHCMVRNGVQLSSNIIFIRRAQNGADSSAAQTCYQSISPSPTYVSGGWTQDSDGTPADWQGGRFACSTGSGVFPIYQVNAANLYYDKIWGTGYPTNYPPPNTNGQMWEDFGTITSTQAYSAAYEQYTWKGDLIGGQSGGPMFSNIGCGTSTNGGYCEYGVLTGTESGVNIGHAFGSGEVNRLACFRDHPGTSC